MPDHILIADCDHGTIEAECRVAAQRGAALTAAQCTSEDELIDAARDADGLIVQYAPVTRRVLEALPRLRVVGRYGVGVDTIDVSAATARGVIVTNVPDYGTEDVSDHAIALVLCLVRAVVRLDRRVRRAAHDLTAVKPLHRLNTLTLGVVGLGRIGAATARKARGIGLNVIGCDPAVRAGTVTAESVLAVTLGRLLAESDVVSVHAPLSPSTFHLISDREFRSMKPGAHLVNTSRGAVVDTDALVRALKSGRLAGAALDVFETEPLPPTSTLLEFDNVVLTPHAAWYSEESFAELKRRIAENVVDACAGIRPRDVVNPEAWTAGGR